MQSSVGTGQPPRAWRTWPASLDCPSKTQAQFYASRISPHPVPLHVPGRKTEMAKSHMAGIGPAFKNIKPADVDVCLHSGFCLPSPRLARRGGVGPLAGGWKASGVGAGLSESQPRSRLPATLTSTLCVLRSFPVARGSLGSVSSCWCVRQSAALPPERGVWMPQCPQRCLALALNVSVSLFLSLSPTPALLPFQFSVYRSDFWGPWGICTRSVPWRSLQYRSCDSLGLCAPSGKGPCLPHQTVSPWGQG